MIIKATVNDTTDGTPREILVDQLLCTEGVPYAVFSSDSGMRYEDFELTVETNG